MLNSVPFPFCRGTFPILPRYRQQHDGSIGKSLVIGFSNILPNNAKLVAISCLAGVFSIDAYNATASATDGTGQSPLHTQEMKPLSAPRVTLGCPRAYFAISARFSNERLTRPGKYRYGITGHLSMVHAPGCRVPMQGANGPFLR